jgi:predicted DNA-binding protein
MEARHNKKQFRAQLPVSTVERLEKLALRLGKRSASTIGAEIILNYLDTWEQVEGQHRQAGLKVKRKPEHATQTA